MKYNRTRKAVKGQCLIMCPLRFGNWNNTTNAGVWYINLNNNRANSNNNVSGRA